MNKVFLTGRITKDPEIRYTPNGLGNLMFTIAVDRLVKDAQGNRQADFISCVAWGQQADFMSRYVRKGNMLCVAGRIQTRNYQGQDGQTHYVTEVVVEQVENLSPRDPNAQQTQQPQQQNNFQPNNNPYSGYNNPTYGQTTPNYSQQPKGPSTGNPSSYNIDVEDGDLPF